MTSVGGLRLDEAEVRGLGAPAVAALAIGAWHCACELTDGILTREALAGLGIAAGSRQKLIKAGLWQELEDGSVQVVDYLEHNPARSYVEARRGKAVQRMKRVRMHVRANTIPETPPVRANNTANVQANGDAISPVPSVISSFSGSSPDPEPSSTLSSPPKDLIRSARDSETQAKVREVFDCWREVHNHPGAKLDRGKASRIRSRLSEGFTVEQLCRAIRNAKNDRFLMGENDDGKRYDDLISLLRDASKVERLIAQTIPTAPRKSKVANDRELLPHEEERVQRLLATARPQ